MANTAQIVSKLRALAENPAEDWNNCLRFVENGNLTYFRRAREIYEKYGEASRHMSLPRLYRALKNGLPKRVGIIIKNWTSDLDEIQEFLENGVCKYTAASGKNEVDKTAAEICRNYLLREGNHMQARGP